MRKLFIIMAIVFAVLGIVLTILPTEKLGLIPVSLSVLFAFLAVRKSGVEQTKFPKIILVFSLILVIIAIGKIVLTKDEIVIDQQDEIIKIESQKQDQKDLEELDGL